MDIVGPLLESQNEKKYILVKQFLKKKGPELDGQVKQVKSPELDGQVKQIKRRNPIGYSFQNNHF